MTKDLIAYLLRPKFVVPFFLVLLVLAPYRELLIGAAIPIPDDIFISDLADGEFPVRTEIGRLLKSGESPFWLKGIFTGALGALDPFSAIFFSFLPPSLALGWMISFLLGVAALGTYALARQLGATRLGSFMSGFIFPWSGFFVCQLRHLSIIGVVAFFPLGLFCLEKAASQNAIDSSGQETNMSARKSLLWLLAFSLVFGIQILAGFPQSAYISGLAYSALIAAHAVRLFFLGRKRKDFRNRSITPTVLIAGFAFAVCVSALIGMMSILPLKELGSFSDRSAGASYEWATHFNYWGRNVLSFIVPYINGDISDLSYKGDSIFWEDYGYVGLITLLLSLVALIKKIRCFPVVFWGLATFVAYMLVLGNITPFYRIAFELLPFLSTFRFPTRFLFVVELGLSLLGGIGLSILQEGSAKRFREKKGAIISQWILVCLVALTVFDLFYHHIRQNPLADADTWLSPPRTAEMIKADGHSGRVFTPASTAQHINLFNQSKGWNGDLSGYYKHRELLQPNSNLLHGVATLDGYSGISPRWVIDLIGDHNRRGFLWQLYRLCPDDLEALPAFFDWLEALSVRWLVLPVHASSDRLQHLGSNPPVELYRLNDTLPRVRVVNNARIVESIDELWTLVASEELDVKKEVILHDQALAPLITAINMGAEEEGLIADAKIIVDKSTELIIEATAAKRSLLLVADTFYPGWEATVDGQPTPIFRANIAHRAVELTPGKHQVVFRFNSRAVKMGLQCSAAGILVLIFLLVAIYTWKPKYFSQ